MSELEPIKVDATLDEMAKNLRDLTRYLDRGNRMSAIVLAQGLAVLSLRLMREIADEPIIEFQDKARQAAQEEGT